MIPQLFIFYYVSLIESLSMLGSFTLWFRLMSQWSNPGTPWPLKSSNQNKLIVTCSLLGNYLTLKFVFQCPGSRFTVWGERELRECQILWLLFSSLQKTGQSKFHPVLSFVASSMCLLDVSFYCFYVWSLWLLASFYFQKNHSNVKPIPAFKPIPNENGTPDSSPEKIGSIKTEDVKVLHMSVNS